MKTERSKPLLKFFKEARRRHVHTTAAAYIAVALVLIQVGDALFAAVGLGAGANRVFTLILFLALPLVLVLSWLFDVRGGIVRSEWFEGDKPAAKPRALSAVMVNRAAPPEERPRAPTPALDTGSEPAPERVQRATLAHIRHELKTPINAIIG